MAVKNPSFLELLSTSNSGEDAFVILDGPIGTQLHARGIPTPLPYWSAGANDPRNPVANEALRSIHQEYDRSGARIHTANTFRTQRRTVGSPWQAWTRSAVDIARSAVPATSLVAGSLAPLEDCYRPDLMPDQPDAEHLEMATMLLRAGCDLILCETFCNPIEALAATQAAITTGLPVGIALTAGPEGNLMSPREMVVVARRCIDAGATAVLVNCTPASLTLPFVEKLANANMGVPIGAYANAGHVDEKMGWHSPEISCTESTNLYMKHVRDWVTAGATILGGCCGTGPAHVRAISEFVNH